MREVKLPSGNVMPVLGLGTWRMGEDDRERGREADALRYGLDLGFTLIDTAEMYGDGGAEEVVAEAIRGRRDRVVIVSKVYPYNASRRAAVEACARSLTRLQTDYIDVYLLHWPGAVPLEETFAVFQDLRDAGKIRDFGVSNFDLDLIREARRCDGGLIATNQIYYNLAQRNAEWALLPWHRRQGIPVMAYSPFDQGRLLDEPELAGIAERHDATPAQVALSWLLGQEGMVTIPKSSSQARVAENFGALELTLSDEDRAALDRAFPPPKRPMPIEII